MKSQIKFLVACGVVACMTTVGPAVAQTVTGTLGSPSATTTLKGNQLPPEPPKFGGVIKEDAAESKSWWPPRVVPPKGAPNVLLIMTDDQGYGVSGTFGGVIPTPAMDRVAKAGLRYTQFHSTALCSPTRAALITGRNHHSVGFGVIGELSTGFPGYDSIIGPENATAMPPRGSAKTTTPRGSSTAWPAPSSSGPAAWASTTSTVSWEARRTSGGPTYSRITRRSSRGWASRATTSSPTWPTRRLST
jgi:Sulfatase